MSNALRVVGRTEDGKRVMAGAFWLVSSDGIPLEAVLREFEKHDMVVDWQDFMRTAEAEGWGRGPTETKILAAVGDVYGPPHRDAVALRLGLLRERETSP